MRNSKHAVKKSKMVKAKTRFQVLQSPIGGFPVTLMKLMPLTGRTHQLRIQCQKHRLPIVGDRSYGNFPFNREVAAHTNIKRLLLHSAETHIHYTHEGKVRDFSAISKLPEDFKIVLNYRPSQKTLLPGNGRSASLSSRRFKI
jgi:23S rRNA-/tRNA-specific pseudouridylate synthase